MPKCSINGQEIEVQPGTTIIEAFKRLDNDIAHYCWHPGLTVAGVCRLCMVEIEGMPKLQIACNTEIRDGMVITNQSEKVKDTVRWGMDFHLINHPLDCPICDQAGECGLQEQYMKFGKYDPEMAERKVKKRKVVDLGPRVVLDSERCILCSRCVRFTDEVSKTNELGIFNRGDRSEVGTFEDKPLDNNYSINTVDICPVGALTSKDFRFRQRVWYLKDQETICTGCATGCNVRAYYNEEGLFRVRPEHNEEVNGYWMCDEGRDLYRFINRDHRLTQAKTGHQGQWNFSSAGAAAKEVGEKLRGAQADEVALVLTGQYSNEEYESVLEFFVRSLGTQQIYHWINNPETFDEFDGLLLRGDKNPNTKGLLDALEAHKITSPWVQLEEKIQSGKIKYLVVAGPENQSAYRDLEEKLALFGKASHLVYLSSCSSEFLDALTTPCWQIPQKAYVEKTGTYVNYNGLAQKTEAFLNVVPGALSLSDTVTLMKGEDLTFDQLNTQKYLKTNFFTRERGQL